MSAIGNGVNISYIYDGDGVRVIKNMNGTITRYLTDDGHNPTGYVQVLEELGDMMLNKPLQKRYIYGLDLISQTDTIGTAGTQYYGYDGIGSVRLLTDASGNVTDTYDYDAFGTLIYHNGATANNYLFQGQQYDMELGQYYLRARYMQQNIGRFWTMDSYEGINEDPLSLHKYLFTADNPVNLIDASGQDFNIMSLGIEIAMISILSTMPAVLYATDDKESKIKELIQDFYNAAKNTALIGVNNINVLGSLGWSESPNGKLGYWDSKAGPANGIMQLYDPKYAGLSDAENILQGTKILNDNKAIENKARKANGGSGQITLYGEKYTLTTEQEENEWDLSVWLYKGQDTGNTHDWLFNIYRKWPRATGKQVTSEPLISLWNKKDTFLIK